MKLLKNIIGLIHVIRPFYLSHLIFCLSSFYEFTAKVGNKMSQILEPKYRKSWKQNVNIVIKFWNQYLGVFLSLIWDRNNRFLSRWTLFLCSFAFKIDYILLLFLFVIVVGLIPSISAIVKSITKKPIKVINSED